MMVKSLYNKYFQKSKSFLYPALGIKRKSEFNPTGTYISIEGCIGPEDIKLICTFEANTSEKFIEFEKNMLIENPLFIKKIHIENYYLYIFDFHLYEDDWFSFILGRYSKLSKVLKRAIKSYYGAGSVEYEHIDMYLNPSEYFEYYSEQLDIDIEELKEIGELCNAYDADKENLVIPEKYFDEIKTLL